MLGGIAAPPFAVCNLFAGIAAVVFAVCESAALVPQPTIRRTNRPEENCTRRFIRRDIQLRCGGVTVLVNSPGRQSAKAG